MSKLEELVNSFGILWLVQKSGQDKLKGDARNLAEWQTAIFVVLLILFLYNVPFFFYKFFIISFNLGNRKLVKALTL